MTCTTNCQVVVRICATTVCGNATGNAVPSGTAMVINLKNNGTSSDSIQKAAVSGLHHRLLDGSGAG